MKFRAMIIEDEDHSRHRLKRILGKWSDEIEIVGEADNGPAAVEGIRGKNPDLVFLDINLPGLDGFQVLEHLEKQPFVIFTTADERQALNAFKTNAIDYLLKPIEEDALERSVAKLRNFSQRGLDVESTLAGMIKSMQASYLSRITCKVGEKMVLVKTGEVLFFQADNKYTTVQTSGKTFLIDTPLVELEKQLDPKDFVRIHRGTLVNVAWILEIRKLFDGKHKVVLLDKLGTELLASRYYADNLKNIR